jgi:prolyl-tRNA synthetase
MKQSELFAKTLKEAPKDEKSINAQLLLRAGFIYKEMAGVYSYLPLGLKVLKKIENIIREEMNRIGGQEILMTVLQPKKLWEETGRWSKEIGEAMYKCREDTKEIGLGPTHEEMLTDIVRHYVKSYTDLPLYLYQIQTKFRKEPRARSGLLRGREFAMKDLYSFHDSEEDFKKYYQKAIGAYHAVFKRCGLKTILTEASGKGFTKGYTHEFQVLSEGGEDRIVYCPQGDFSQNKEIAKLGAGNKCPRCGQALQEGRSIEVGNIFPLGTKYAKAMNAFFADKEGKRKTIIMGCYGIGTSRTMAAAVEVHHDERGIIWPEEISPFNIHLLQIENSPKIKSAAEKIYKDLQKSGTRTIMRGGKEDLSSLTKEVLYDDRERSAGEKFADADLIGIPIRMVVSEKTLKQNSVEIKKRSEKKTKLIKFGEVKKYAK